MGTHISGLPPVAANGLPGAYAVRAAHCFCPDRSVLSVAGFPAVAAAVLSGAAQFGCLPCENRYAGPVTAAIAVILAAPLRILAELWLPIQHALLAQQGAAVAQLTEVASHPQALQQCDVFIRRHHLLPLPAPSTADAAANLAAGGPRHRAAIASVEAANHYGLAVIRRNIATDPTNATRFWLVGSHASPPRSRGPHKVTAAVVPDGTAWWHGPAVHVLHAPAKGPWLVDVARPADWAALLQHARTAPRLLGCYPAAEA